MALLQPPEPAPILHPHRRATSDLSLAPEDGGDCDLQAALDCEGWMASAQLRVLHDLAAAVPADATIVEVGTYRGRSTIALALGSRRGHGAPVYTFDPHLEFRGPRGGAFGPEDQAALYANLHRAGVGETVFVVGLDSKLVARAWPGRTVGLLVVDGDHRREAVWGDFWSWRPHLDAHSVVVFDDVDYGEVAEVVEALVALGALEPLGRQGKMAWFDARPGEDRRRQ